MSLPPPPPETPNQGSQSEANTPENRPVRKIGLGRLFTNIFRLSKATEVEVDKQAQDRVKRFIKEMNMKEQLQQKLSSQIKNLEDIIEQEKLTKLNNVIETSKNEVKNLADGKKGEVEEITSEVKNLADEKKNELKKITSEAEKFTEKTKAEIDKLGERLKIQTGVAISLLSLLGIISLPLVTRILQDFTLIRTLETQIKYLESDIEDLQ